MKTKLIQAALAATIAFAFSAPAHAYQCKNKSISTVAVHKVKIIALNKSKNKWPIRVKNHHGLAWSVFKIAKAKSKSCTKVYIGGVKKWRCERSAKPCLYAVQ